MEQVQPFRIGRLRLERRQLASEQVSDLLGPPEATTDALMLSLDDDWFWCEAQSVGGRLVWVERVAPHKAIEAGMSGSPIVLADGTAIGVICNSGGPNPLLAAQLPAWLVCEEATS